MIYLFTYIYLYIILYYLLTLSTFIKNKIYKWHTQHATDRPTSRDASHLKNIPRPELYPIHGCSEDPEFYVKTYWAGGFEYEKKGVTYYKSSPHGSVYGYRTNVGIVPVPTTPVYGYVWSDHDGANLSADWVLHAIYPEERSESRATRPTPRWTTSRRPPGSRRWPTWSSRRG